MTDKICVMAMLWLSGFMCALLADSVQSDGLHVGHFVFAVVPLGLLAMGWMNIDIEED